MAGICAKALQTNPAALLVLAVVFTRPAVALEKRTVPAPREPAGGEWRAEGGCVLSYYNTCTGFTWAWSGWEPDDRIGVQYGRCTGSGNELIESWMFVDVGAPAGYGFTGSLSVRLADENGCPTGEALATQTYLPRTGWNHFEWGVFVPEGFLLVATHGPGQANPTAYATDHPAPAETGPIACGTCYPAARTERSFWYASEASPLCPGSPFFDGFCGAQLLWRVHLSAAPTSTESSSFGSVKNLYR